MIKKFLSKHKLTRNAYDDDYQDAEDEYLELNASSDSKGVGKVIVRPFVLDDFADVKPILEVLREGDTICLLNIKPLREKDIVELKRSINKIKKTIEAINGDIAGFGEDYIIVAPHFAKIHRNSATEDIDE